MSTTISTLRQLTANLPRAIAQVRSNPQVDRESEYYLSTISKVRSIDDFMRNDRVYRYALKAFGLEEMMYGKAFIRRVLSEGIDARESLANRLADPRFREFAEAFNFARYGSTTTAFARTQQGAVDRYLRQTLETDIGRDNEGLRLALYFQRKAPSVSSAYGLLADRALLEVTRVALGLSASTGSIDIDRQADLINKRMDIADLKDPAKLDKMLNRFAALWDIERPATPGSPIVGLVSGDSSTAIGLDILGRLQAKRKGG